jgi:kinetochore protein Nuf2
MWSFPLLSFDDLVACLEELGITLTIDDLKKPQPELMKQLYASFVEAIFAAGDDVVQPKFTGLQAIEFPELHEDSIPEFTFVHNLNRLMRAVGVKDFSYFQDVMRPEPKRTQRCLSAIINFARFREDRLAKYHELNAETEQLIDDRMQLELETQAQLEKLRDTRAQVESEQPIIASLVEENASLEAEIHKYNQQQALIKGDIEALKTQIKELQARIQDQKFVLVKAKKESQKLQSMIVQSPERVKRQISMMEESLENERGLVNDAKAKLVELGERYNSLCKIEKDVAKFAQAISDNGALVQKIKENKRATKAARVEVASAEQRIRELETRRAHHQRQIKATEEKTTQLSAEHEEKMAQAQRSLEEAKLNRANTERELRTLAQKIDLAKLRTVTLKSQIEEMNLKHSNEVAALEKSFEELEAAMSQFHANLEASLTPVLAVQ